MSAGVLSSSRRRKEKKPGRRGSKCLSRRLFLSFAMENYALRCLWIKLISVAFLMIEAVLGRSFPCVGKATRGEILKWDIPASLPLPHSSRGVLIVTAPAFPNDFGAQREMFLRLSNIYFLAIYEPNYVRKGLRSCRGAIRDELLPHVELALLEDNRWRSILRDCKEKTEREACGSTQRD